MRRIEPLDRAAVEQALGIPLRQPLFLVTYHPVTVVHDSAAGVEELIAALSDFSEAVVVQTGVNADSGNDAIAQTFAAYAARHPAQVVSRASLGQRLYLSTMRYADVLVGNSSSGLVEAPAIGVPTVNIGDRQAGRLRAASVIDCVAERAAIRTAIKAALAPEFRAAARRQNSLYGDGFTAGRIKDFLKTIDLNGILLKQFHDLPMSGAALL